ncbi:5-(carboxyamino)imidazole ribonucleotide mutase [bacterium]|nr:5-(carboxyamino)imidazole ribonucleotide mutase [bacterium]
MGVEKPVVGILMGSDSDWAVMRKAADALAEFGIGWEAHIMSAHRTPDLAANYAREAESRGVRVIIAGAGMAAHLAGSLAAQTVLPVIGVPLAAGSLQGMDALLATVQMPPGVPVATVGVGAAQNAALLAIQILGTADEALRRRFAEYKNKMAESVAAKDEKLQSEIK